jgi:hypothetical protein
MNLPDVTTLGRCTARPAVRTYGASFPADARCLAELGHSGSHFAHDRGGCASGFGMVEPGSWTAERTARTVAGWNQQAHTALGYAWGRLDAEHTTGADAVDFATRYRRLVVAHSEGRSNYRPSIADAWTDYLAELCDEVDDIADMSAAESAQCRGWEMS